jgi:hypothetical protein
VIGRRTRLLSRTFFDRLFENDLFSSSVSASTAVMWLLAALATPGVMFSGSQYYFYAHARTFAPALQDRILFVSQAFHVAFAMAMAGLMTMLVWTSIAPDRRDALVLGSLPVTSGEQARAKLLALVRVFTIFATAVSVPTAVAFTFVTVGDASGAEFVRRVVGHIGSTMLGAGFVFFWIVAVHVLLAATWGPRAVAAAALPLQVAALLALVLAISMTGRLADALLSTTAASDSALFWNPAAWFVGIYRWIAGDGREVFATLAMCAVTGVVGGAAVTMGLYPLAYRRCLGQALAVEGRRATWWAGAASRVWLQIMSPLLRTPLEKGLATFILANFTRSHTHRFLIGSYIGMGFLFAIPMSMRFFESPDRTAVHIAWFSLPLGLLCWTAAGIRVAMMLPIDAASNWIFKLTEPVDKARVLSTVVSVMLGLSALPLAAFFGIAAAAAGGATLGASVFAVVLATGAALIELLTLTLRTVPGACTYRPGQLRLRLLWPVYLFLWLIVAYGVPRLASNVLGDLPSMFGLITVLVSIWACLRAWGHHRARKLPQLVYEEAEASITTTISIQSA